MNYKTTFFLLVMLLAVGGFFFYLKQTSPPTGTTATTTTANVRSEGQPLWATAPITADEVTSLTITRSGQTYRFVKEGTDWWQVQPVRFALNNWSAREMIDAALNLRQVEKFIPDGKNNPALTDLSLQPPAVTVTLAGDNSAKKPVTLQLGRTTVGGRGYLMIEGDPSVYVVNNRLHTPLFEGNLADWRRKTITMPALAEATALSLTTPEGVIELAKRDEQWVFVGASTGRADGDALAGLVGSVTGMFISKFVSDNPNDIAVYGLDKPFYQLVIDAVEPPLKTAFDESEKSSTGAGTVTHRFLVGGPTDMSMEKFFATLSRTGNSDVVVFEVSKTDVEKLRKKVDELRDPRLVTLPAGDITALKFSMNQGSSVMIAKSPEGWVFASPQPPYNLDRVEVSRLLDRLVNLRATSFINQPNWPTTATAVVELSSETTTEPMRLSLYPADNDEHWLVQRTGETLGYVVEKTALPLPTSALALRDRVVADINAAELARIEIIRPGKVTVILERTTRGDAANPQHSPWQLRGHASFEPFALEELTKQLSPLRAQNWVEGDATQVDEATVLRMNVTTMQGQTWSLQVDPATRQARVTGVDAAFIIMPELLTALQAEFGKTAMTTDTPVMQK